jgi:putative ABC transport system permease protein
VYWLRRFLFRLQPLFRKKKIEAEMSAEIRLHLEMQTEANVAAGMSPAEARAAARRECGGMDQAMESYRDERGLRWIEDVWRDLCFAFRSLRKSPGFTAVAVLTLALGIGGVTAMFSVVNAVLWRPLPYRAAGEIFVLQQQNVRPDGMTGVGGVPPEHYLELRKQSRAFAPLAAFRQRRVRLAGDEEAVQVPNAEVSGDFFALLGVGAEIGRTLTPEDAQPGATAAAVISHGMWQRLFGGNADVLGKSVEINRSKVTIVGVMPRRFEFPGYFADRCEVWTPWAIDAGDYNRNRVDLTLLGRLVAGVTPEQAQAGLDAWYRGLTADQPKEMGVTTLRAQNLREQTVGEQRGTLLLLLGAVGCLLLIACANVANLLLVRAAGRTREIAIRLSVGASRGQLLRQLLVESMTLATLGGVAGIVLARWSLDSLVALAARVLPRVEETTLDGRVLGFALVLSLGTGVIVGLWPAWRASRGNLLDHLKQSASAGSFLLVGRSRARHLLAGAQIAFSLTLLLGAGLLLRSFLLLSQVDPGFEPRRALVVTLGTGAAAQQDDLMARLRTLPGVEAVGSINSQPLFVMSNMASVRIDGNADGGTDPMQRMAHVRIVTPGYFRAVGIRLVTGRELGPDDARSVPGVVVNEAFVRAFLGGQDPLGRQVRAVSDTWCRVVGVAKDVTEVGISNGIMPEIYHPAGLTNWGNITCIVVRSASEDLSFLVTNVREIIRNHYKGIPIISLQPMANHVWESIAPQRLNTWLFGVFSALALAICLVGIYGVVSFSVAQRTHEFGVRMALGAGPDQVAALPLREAAPFLLGGVAAGFLGAVAAGRLLGGLLFHLRPFDLPTFLVATAGFILVALLACWLPARRAARINPMEALRAE